jgi:hypothetical protein
MLKSLRGRAVVLISGATAAGILAGGVAAAAGAAATPAGHWGNAHPVGGLNTGNAGGLAAVSSVSCGSPGNCVAVGSFHTSDHNSHGFFAEEKGGAWGPAAELFVDDSSTLDSASCSGAGDCVIVGHVIDSAPHPFFDVKAHGVWGGPVPLGENGLRGEPVSVSCVPASPGSCAIGGWFDDAQGLAQPFTKGENNGIWGPVQQVTALEKINAGTDAQVNSVSCAVPGSCTAVGYVRTVSGSHHPFITEEIDGRWTFGFPVPELSRITTNSAQADVVSCASASQCALAGDYTDGHGQQQAFVIDKVNGDWLLPQPVPGVADLNAGGFAEVKGVSCGSAGNCVVVGDYAADNHNTFAGFVAEEKGGTWQPAHTIRGTAGSVPGSGSADSVSCPAAGNCVVGGSIGDQAGTHAITLSETGGSWGSPHQLPGTAALSTRVVSAAGAVSCASPGNCAAGGFYQDTPGKLQAFLADESTATTTTLKLSAAKLKFGHEQAEKLTVKVKPRTGGTPSGKVTVVAGSTTVCTIKLAKGKGACTLAAKKLKPGKYRLTGIYGGDRRYAGSAYPSQNLTVVK